MRIPHPLYHFDRRFEVKTRAGFMKAFQDDRNWRIGDMTALSPQQTWLKGNPALASFESGQVTIAQGAQTGFDLLDQPIPPGNIEKVVYHTVGAGRSLSCFSDGHPDLEDAETEDIQVYVPASRLLAEDARK